MAKINVCTAVPAIIPPHKPCICLFVRKKPYKVSIGFLTSHLIDVWCANLSFAMHKQFKSMMHMEPDTYRDTEIENPSHYNPNRDPNQVVCTYINIGYKGLPS